jgi:hypothetical protein
VRFLKGWRPRVLHCIDALRSALIEARPIVLIVFLLRLLVGYALDSGFPSADSVRLIEGELASELAAPDANRAWPAGLVCRAARAGLPIRM